jgi:D-psicose/D-tagatose/L-ribulose 3-epimerase
MKYGAFYHMWFPDVKEECIFPLLPRLREMGFEGLEITLTPDLLAEEGLWGRLRRESREQGIQCLFSTGLSGENSIIASSREIRQKGIAYLRACVDLVASFEGDMLAGILYGPWGDFSEAPPTRAQWEWCKEGLWEVAEYARTCRVFLAMEPANRFETFFLNTAREALQLIREIGHPHLRLHLDTFQMNIEEEDPREAILDAGDLLFHFHCCASHRGVLGDDHLDWVGIFRALKRVGYNRWLVIETFTPEMARFPSGKKVAIWKKFAEPDDIALWGIRFLKAVEATVFRFPE